MGSQPTGMGGMLPGVAAGGGVRKPDDDENSATSDGTAVGEADREADVERSGAKGHHDEDADPGARLITEDLGDTNRSGDNVPVGAADAEADRERTTDDD